MLAMKVRIPEQGDQTALLYLTFLLNLKQDICATARVGLAEVAEARRLEDTRRQELLCPLTMTSG